MNDAVRRLQEHSWTLDVRRRMGRGVKRGVRRGALLVVALVALVALATLGGVARAQTETTTVRGGRPGRGMGRAARVLPRPPGPKQQALAKQVRQAFAGVVRTRLNLNDEQARQLQTTDQRFQKQRNQIGREERQARQALAAALADSGSSPDQAKISEYMDQLIQVQHKRADLLEAEQKELGGFLTPIQRARYLALREQLNRRVREMVQQGGQATPATKPPDE
jgi:hypothetical protein